MVTPFQIPNELFSGNIIDVQLINGGRHYQFVYRVEVDDGSYYIVKAKNAAYAGSLRDEADRLEWLQGKLPIPKLFNYCKIDDWEYIVMSYLEGCSASAYERRDGEPSLGSILGRGLREIHQVDIGGCPFRAYTPEDLIAMVRTTISHQPDAAAAAALVVFPDYTIDGLLDFLEEHKPVAEELVFTHGDYGTGNVIISSGTVQGFIDVGEAGLSDPYLDLYYLNKSLTHYSNRHHELPDFLKAYGLPQLDRNRMKFHQIVDTLLL